MSSPNSARLADRLSGLTEAYASRIVPVDTAAAVVWGRWRARFSVPVADGLMAATADVNDRAFVTRDVEDVERTRVRVADPFTPEATSS